MTVLLHKQAKVPFIMIIAVNICSVPDENQSFCTYVLCTSKVKQRSVELALLASMCDFVCTYSSSRAEQSMRVTVYSGDV